MEQRYIDAKVFTDYNPNCLYITMNKWIKAMYADPDIDFCLMNVLSHTEGELHIRTVVYKYTQK